MTLGHAGVTRAADSRRRFRRLEDIFDIFNSAFGEQQAGRRRSASRGRDRRVDVTIDFVESVFGVEKEIEFQRLEVCDDCDGSGAAAGTRPTTCPRCNGSGEERSVRQTFLGSMVQSHTCPNCGGKARSSRTPAAIAMDRAANANTPS